MPGANSSTGSVQDSNSTALLSAINALVESIDSKVQTPGQDYNSHELFQGSDTEVYEFPPDTCHSLTIVVLTGKVVLEVSNANGDTTSYRLEEGMSMTYQASTTLVDTFVFNGVAGSSFFITKRFKST